MPDGFRQAVARARERSLVGLVDVDVEAGPGGGLGDAGPHEAGARPPLLREIEAIRGRAYREIGDICGPHGSWAMMPLCRPVAPRTAPSSSAGAWWRRAGSPAPSLLVVLALGALGSGDDRPERRRDPARERQARSHAAAAARRAAHLPGLPRRRVLRQPAVAAARRARDRKPRRRWSGAWSGRPAPTAADAPGSAHARADLDDRGGRPPGRTACTASTPPPR